MLFEKQNYQEKCVENIVTALQGVSDIHSNDYSGLTKSLQELYMNNKYSNFSLSNESKIDVVMETGTGKTFTYLKTIFEANQAFGKNKFIIVVPRNAIKLGVIQNIRLTKEYFFNEYKKHLNIIEYPKDGLAKIENDFLNNDNKLSVLVLTNSSFNSKNNNINQLPENGSLYMHGTIWQNIAKQKPIVIIDEPHLLKGNQTTKYFDELDTLFIRFGATYPKDAKDAAHHLSNVAYSLDSISSFNEYLVKKIRVNTVFTADTEAGNYKLFNIDTKKKKFSLAYFINEDNKTCDIKLKEDIGVKTGISSLHGVHATKITAKEVFLSSGNTLTLEKSAELSEDEIRLMVRQTIDKHFEKEERLSSP